MKLGSAGASAGESAGSRRFCVISADRTRCRLAPGPRAGSIRVGQLLPEIEQAGRRRELNTTAKKAFERALELSPRHFLAMIGITYSLLQDGDDAAGQTLALLQLAAEIAPNSLRVRTVFGDYYSGFEETEKAVKQYKAATDQNPTYYPGFLSAGVTLSAAEQTEPSEATFRTVIQINPKIPRPLFK